MNYTLDALMKEVGCEKYPARWGRFFDEAMAKYAQEGNVLTDPAYYDTLQEKYRCMEKYIDLYKKAAVQTAGNEALSRFLFLLAFALKDRENRNNDIAELKLLPPQDREDGLAYRMVTGLAVCSQLDEGNETLMARGIPEAYRRRSLKAAVDCGVNSYMRLHGGQAGYRLLGWAQHYINGKMFIIGRLEVEFDCAFKGMASVYKGPNGERIALAHGIVLHKSGFALGSKHYEDALGSWQPFIQETSDSVTGHPYRENGAVSREKVVLQKKDWRLVLTNGDPVISLHIPDRPGEPLTPAVMDSTLEEIRAFAADIGYTYKGFICHSWLMDPQLKALVGPESNMVKFSDRFSKLTARSAGESVFTFVYKCPDMTFEIGELPERTRLERGIKEHYLCGKAIYETIGYFWEEPV